MIVKKPYGHFDIWQKKSHLISVAPTSEKIKKKNQAKYILVNRNI